MSAETTIGRWDGEREDRVPGLGNLRGALDLSAAVARKGNVYYREQNGRNESSCVVGAYGGNKYRVRYHNKPGIGFEDFDITGVDMGISVFYGNLCMPPFHVTVDYYYGQRNVQEVLEGLEPISQSQSADTRIIQPISSIDPNTPFIGTIPGLKEPYYIFTRSFEEAGRLYAEWFEDLGNFDAMHRVLADQKSPLDPFLIKALWKLPYYLKLAELNQSEENTEIKNVTPI
jgi:hypothetical protein